MASLGRRDAFSRNKSPLYFSEILQFVQFSDEFTTASVSRSEIAASMGEVNKKRADAHAKDIDETAFKQLTKSFELLEDIFLPPA